MAVVEAPWWLACGSLSFLGHHPSISKMANHGVLERGQIALPYAKLAKACYVGYRDVAEAAALALTGEKLAYGTFELCAPGMVIEWNRPR